mgnify:CR=1 FL=1
MTDISTTQEMVSLTGNSLMSWLMRHYPPVQKQVQPSLLANRPLFVMQHSRVNL